jgi:hypothetical protein
MGRRVELITGVTRHAGTYLGSTALERLAQFHFDP